MVRLNIFDKIFCVFPVGLIGAARKNLFPIRFRVLCFPFAFAKGLHTSQAVIRLLVQGFGILLVSPSQEKPPPSYLIFVEAEPPPARPSGHDIRQIHFL